MTKYKQKRKLVKIKCDYCDTEFEKPKSEYDRNIKLNRHNFCSRSCSGKYVSSLNLPPSPAQLNNRERIKNFCANRASEYSPFLYVMRTIRNRFKDVDVDVEYLKEVWERQKGICPYTKLKLILPTYTISPDVKYRASLDRIDSTKGYIKGNVQFISTPINYLKNTMSDEETKSFLKEIAASIFIEN